MTDYQSSSDSQSYDAITDQRSSKYGVGSVIEGSNSIYIECVCMCVCWCEVQEGGWVVGYSETWGRTQAVG